MSDLSRDQNRELQPPKFFKTYLRTKADSSQHLRHSLTSKPLKTFPTGSTYKGQYDRVGFAGIGIYKFPHGAIYEGCFKDGQFHGYGTIKYPKGQQMDGLWENGRLKRSSFRFPDGLLYEKKWKYCEMPDRSFQTEINEGLKPAGAEQLTNKQPPIVLKPHCYDTVDGYYDSKTKCVYSDKDEILRVATAQEEKQIKQYFRRYEDVPTGYRPDLYEEWTWGKSKKTEKE